MSKFNLFQSRLNRDEAIKAIEENADDFPERIDAWFLATVEDGAYVRFEELRHRATESGITPHHHNAWGARSNCWVKRKWLIDTGRRRSMEDPSSHARKTPVYRVNKAAARCLPIERVKV